MACLFYARNTAECGKGLEKLQGDHEFREIDLLMEAGQRLPCIQTAMQNGKIKIKRETCENRWADSGRQS